MTKPKKDPASPNSAIDLAIKKLMLKVKDLPEDTAVKIINTAIAWEKVKKGIKDVPPVFDPDQI
jgi:hypothetical protein